MREILTQEQSKRAGASKARREREAKDGIINVEEKKLMKWIEENG